MAVSKTPNGRWRALVKSGRTIVATRTFDLKRDAEAWHDAQPRAHDLGEFVDPKAGKERLADALGRWMVSRAGTVAGSTLKADRGRLNYIPARLGNLPVSKVRSADVPVATGRPRAWRALPVIRHSGPCSAVLLLRLGEAPGHRLRLPVQDTRVPHGLATAPKAEVYPFTVSELREVVCELRERAPRQADLALVLGLTGLRWGELAALRVRDVASVPHPALIVSRSAPDGQEVRTRTKGGRGRSVPLTAELVPVIQSWAEGKEPDDFLLTSEEGHRLNNSNWRRIVGWSKSCRGRRIHDLRHTAATFWLSSGVDVKTVQQWLGHASAQLTLNLYSHWMGSTADAAAIAKINATLSQGYAGGARAQS